MINFVSLISRMILLFPLASGFYYFLQLVDFIISFG